MLIGHVNDDAKRIFTSIASASDFEIEVMETDKDHLHFLTGYIPRLSIAQIVGRLKQESTRQIWQLHSTTLPKQYKQYWYQKLFWRMVTSSVQ